MIDPYLPFVRETLKQYPKLTASRLHEMVRQRGYEGSISQFRHLVARYRPKPSPEAYLRLRTLPGEQAQCDWAHFGHLQIGKAKRPLMAFVMVLSWSRQTYVQFFLNANTASFIRGHVGAFEAWQGVPRVVLYDNLKSAVLERRGDLIRFNPHLIAISKHYHFDPRPVALARGNQKGRVERAIRYIRSAFFEGRTFSDVADLNQQALVWCQEVSSQRRCPDAEELTVEQAFDKERSHLLSLPATPFLSEEVVVARVGKTPYVRFDLNDYSVPHEHVQRQLTVSASQTEVRILDGQSVLATHERSYDRGQHIECKDHIEALAQSKRAARHHRTHDQLLQAVPDCAQFLTLSSERGEPIGRTAGVLTDLLNRYGAEQLRLAVADALAREVPHTNAVTWALERQRAASQTPVPIGLTLPEHIKQRDQRVQPHQLQSYDTLLESNDE
jgi:transposase